HLHRDPHSFPTRRSSDLIGMPVGGICAGQLYLLGDGRLAYWQIFNHPDFTGYGDNCYRTFAPAAPVAQGFTLKVKPEKGEQQLRDRKSTRLNSSHVKISY